MQARHRFLLVLASTLALGACASTEVQRERARESFGRDLAPLNAQAAQPGFKDASANAGKLVEGLAVINLGPGKPATEIAGGKAYYAVIELPEFTRGYHVEILPVRELIASNALGQTMTWGAIWPALSLLDANRDVIATLMPTYAYEADRYLWAGGGNFGYVSICDEQSRYLAVHGVPPIYKRVSGDIATTYSQYGSSSIQMTNVQMPSGDIKIGIPTKPVGTTIWSKGGGAKPCPSAGRTLEAFLGELGAS